MFTRVGPLFALLSLAPASGAPAPRVTLGVSDDCNAAVLRVINAMPSGGSYSTTAQANLALASAIALGPQSLQLDPVKAQPSYCSGATYLAFVGAVQALIGAGKLALDEPARSALLVQGQRDGEGIWGRWNANGPGTARLFAELKLGRNFTDWSKARSGDFMKIFWTAEIGKFERGHSVVYLGPKTIGGVEHVNFWSSNQPLGYGFKVVPRSKIAWAVFSRLESPAGLATSTAIPRSDKYLASLLTVRSSQEEVRARCALEP